MIECLLLLLTAGGVEAQDPAKIKTVWHPTYKEAQAEALRVFKPMLIYGFLKTDDGSSQRMWDQVILREEIDAALARDFVCVRANFANHMSPPGDVDKFFNKIVGDKTKLPILVYLTPDGKPVRNTTGFRNAATFQEDLLAALRSEGVRVPPASEKKLLEKAEEAAKSLQAGKYAAVIRTAREVEKVRGWSDAKPKLRELLTQADASGRKLLEEAAGLAKEGKFPEAFAPAKKVQSEFAGTALEPQAAIAVKSLDRLISAASCVEKGAKPEAKRLYELILKEGEGSPFAAIAREKLGGL